MANRVVTNRVVANRVVANRVVTNRVVIAKDARSFLLNLKQMLGEWLAGAA